MLYLTTVCPRKRNSLPRTHRLRSSYVRSLTKCVAAFLEKTLASLQAFWAVWTLPGNTAALVLGCTAHGFFHCGINCEWEWVREWVSEFMISLGKTSSFLGQIWGQGREESLPTPELSFPGEDTALCHFSSVSRTSRPEGLLKLLSWYQSHKNTNFILHLLLLDSPMSCKAPFNKSSGLVSAGSFK